MSEYEDPSAIAAAIRRVCEDSARRDAMQTRVHEAARPFCRERIAGHEVAIYEELLGAPSPSLQRRVEIGAWRLWQRPLLRRARAAVRRGLRRGAVAPVPERGDAPAGLG